MTDMGFKRYGVSWHFGGYSGRRGRTAKPCTSGSTPGSTSIVFFWLNRRDKIVPFLVICVSPVKSNWYFAIGQTSRVPATTAGKFTSTFNDISPGFLTSF